MTVGDLAWVDPAGVTVRPTSTALTRTEITRERASRAWAGDHVGVARLNAIFAAEGFRRSRLVLDRWLTRFDPATGLLPSSLEPDGQLWAYGDTGSDLYPHLAIATHLLAPEHDRLFTRLLEAERKLGPDVPDDVRIPGGQPVGLDLNDRIFGTAEYAKDGLLPMLDRLGPDPWLGRLVEIADKILAASATPTRSHGMMPADSTEVNGDMLQVLARAYWATGDKKYLEAANRIGRTYTQEVFPTTTYLPPNRWDFVEKEPLDRRRFRLSDHGNEILLRPARVAPRRDRRRRSRGRHGPPGDPPDAGPPRRQGPEPGRPLDAGHRDPLRQGRSGRLLRQLGLRLAGVPDPGARRVGSRPDGDPAAGARYREVAAKSLGALASYRFYNWQSGEMDGYADAIESAIYILHEVDDPAAELWLDDQIGALYGFQKPDGAVVERDLDGNFIRSALLNAFRLTGGARLDPWSPDLLLGGSRDGDCLTLWATSSQDWQGKLILDRPRHRDFMNMPYDYPRLNKWPEWFTAAAGTAYRVTDSQGTTSDLDGKALIDGLPLTLPAGQERTIRVCRA